MAENHSDATPHVDQGAGVAPLTRGVDELQQAFQAQSARLDEVLRAYSRLQQDKDDFRRRSERERERVLEAERGNVALGLLEAVDQLDLTLQAVPAVAPGGCESCQALSKGVRLIRDNLLRQVEQNGIVRLQTAGAAFDPSQHEAIGVVEVNDRSQDGLVVGELRAGYRQGERILRPARVTVGRAHPESPARSPADLLN